METDVPTLTAPTAPEASPAESPIAEVLQEAAEPAQEAPAEEREPEVPEILNLPENWHERPEVADLLQQKYAEGQSHQRKGLNKLIEEVNETHQTLVQRAEQRGAGSAIVQRFGEFLGNLDPQDRQSVGQALRDNETWMSALSEGSFTEGLNAVTVPLPWSEEMTADMSEDAKEEFKTDVNELHLKLQRNWTGDREKDAKTMLGTVREMISRRDKIRDPIIRKTALESEKGRLDKIATEEAQTKVRAENRGKPPVKPTGGAGGGKQYSQMTREERSALSPAERDALVAREMQGA